MPSNNVKIFAIRLRRNSNARISIAVFDIRLHNSYIDIICVLCMSTDGHIVCLIGKCSLLNSQILFRQREAFLIYTEYYRSTKHKDHSRHLTWRSFSMDYLSLIECVILYCLNRFIFNICEYNHKHYKPTLSWVLQ